MSSSDHRVLSKLLTTATHCEHILLDKLRNCIAASYNLALFTKDGVFERIVTGRTITCYGWFYFWCQTHPQSNLFSALGACVMTRSKIVENTMNCAESSWLLFIPSLLGMLFSLAHFDTG